jgi:hypothetical protein
MAPPAPPGAHPIPSPPSPRHVLQARRPPHVRKSWMQLIFLRRRSPPSSSSSLSPVSPPPHPPAAPQARRRRSRPGPLLNLAGLHPGVGPVDCTSSSSSGEVSATTLAAFDHRCYRSSHGDGHSSADTWMSLLKLFCYVATEGGCACYQRHSACLLRRHPWRTPRSSKRNSPGPSPTPPRPPMAHKLDRRSNNHVVVEHGAARDGRGDGATCGCRRCYTRLVAVLLCSVDVWYKGRRPLLQRAVAR